MRFLFRSFARSGNQLSQSAGLLYGSKSLPWVLIGLGVLLRLAQYLANRSLWLDESCLALNIVNRSFSELLQPLDYYQGAPIGFLMLERLAVYAFGNSEYALRLIPFLSGIVSLFLFYEVAKRCITPNAVLIALGLFAILEPLIYYSSEVKQYSSDVAMALILYLATIYVERKHLTIARVALVGVIGAIAIWFSHPAVFIMAGVGVSLTLFYLAGREWTKIGRISIVYLLWVLSFAAAYFVSLRNLSHNEGLLNYWSDSFAPFPPLSFSDAKWFVSNFFGIFEEPVGLTLSGIAALTFLVGFVSMFLESEERFFVLISPIFVTLAVSAFHKYPFRGRLLLFIVPSVLLFIAKGAEQIRYNTKHQSSIIGIILLGLLFFHPLFSSTYHLIRPRISEEIKPVINYIREHQQDGDVLYLYYASQYAFKYYSARYGFNNNNYIVGVSSRDNWGNYIDDLDKLRDKKRVWILFSHVYNWKSVDEEKFFLYRLDVLGTRLESFKNEGASVYLYDLSKETLKTFKYVNDQPKGEY
jgi:hypothetical protein